MGIQNQLKPIMQFMITTLTRIKTQEIKLSTTSLNWLVAVDLTHFEPLNLGLGYRHWEQYNPAPQSEFLEQLSSTCQFQTQFTKINAIISRINQK